MAELNDGAARGGGLLAFLHIGTMKSGTSYLQDVLQRNREALGEAGLFVPDKLAAAVADVLNREGKRRKRSIAGAWDKAMAEAGAWTGRAVILSQEHLGGASTTEASRIVSTLPSTDVRVIITARDLVRVIPSHWQTSVKQGGTWTLEDFCQALTHPSAHGDKQPYKGFWRHHDLAGLVAIWGGAVGVENVYLVTVPPSGAAPTALWERFCEVLEIDPGNFNAQPQQQANFSLSLSATEMFRRVNEALDREIDQVAHRRIVTGFLANRVLRDDTPEAAASDKPRLSPRMQAFAAERGQQMVEAIAKSRVNVVGDIDDLVPPPPDDPTDMTVPPPRLEAPAEAIVAIAALVSRLVERDADIKEMRGELRDLRTALRAAESSQPGRRPVGDRPEADPVANDSANADALTRIAGTRDPDQAPDDHLNHRVTTTSSPPEARLTIRVVERAPAAEHQPPTTRLASHRFRLERHGRAKTAPGPRSNESSHNADESSD